MTRFSTPSVSEEFLRARSALLLTPNHRPTDQQDADQETTDQENEELLITFFSRL